MKSRFLLKTSRFWLLGVMVGACTGCAPGENDKSASANDGYRPWTTIDEPLAELERVRGLINPPEFPDRDFMVTDYGAVGDGTTLNTEAFKAAIEAGHESGGGRGVEIGRAAWR